MPNAPQNKFVHGSSISRNTGGMGYSTKRHTRRFSFTPSNMRKVQIANEFVNKYGSSKHDAAKRINYPKVLWYKLEFESTNLSIDFKIVDEFPSGQWWNRDRTKELNLNDKVNATGENKFVYPATEGPKNPHWDGTWLYLKATSIDVNWSHTRLFLRVQFVGGGSRSIMIFNANNGALADSQVINVRYAFPPPERWPTL